MPVVDLPTLIQRRRRRTGDSLRAMEDRARTAGHPISRSMISAYEHGEVTTQPNRETVAALAAALDLTYGEVAAAANETFGLDDVSPETRRSQRAEAWLRLTGDRTDAEVQELLLIVDQVLRMRDMDRPTGSAKTG